MLSRHCLRRHALGALAAVALAPAAIAAPQETPMTAKQDPQQINAMFDEQWEFWMRENPTWASELGDRRYNTQWTDLSTQGFERRARHDEAMLARAQAIDRARLDPADQVNLDLFVRKVGEDVEERRFPSHLLALDMRYGIQTANETAETLRLETVQDYDDWIARLRAFAPYMDQTIALLDEGVRRGWVQPKIIMQRLPDQIAHQVVDDPTASPFWGKFEKMPEAIEPAEQARLRTEAKAAIRDVVVPAYRRFQTFFMNTYLPACRDTVGASALPGGKEFYAFRVRQMTTTSLTPDEIHQIGEREVARIHAEMERVKKEAGFEGTLQEFFTFLRSDPRFFAKDADELLRTYRDVAKRIDPEIVRLFGRLPRMPYGVKPIPMESAPDTTTAYYSGPADDGSRAGTYWVNLYKPEARPKWEMMALSLHEAVPGHHLQIALAQELGELPKFRRHAGYTAFVEGWGLYSESLGDELGLYDDPYSKFGQLTYEMWRAVRLVVDTGMHELGWSRQQAIDYFKANAAKTELDIVNEIDRYIGWPGQALAYKIGELKIKELRARSVAALGDRFDVKAFHDVVLGSGAVPLDVLERNVDAWIASQQASTTASAVQ
jgi:uncharacterized protein (DUF885 family)